MKADSNKLYFLHILDALRFLTYKQNNFFVLKVVSVVFNMLNFNNHFNLTNIFTKKMKNEK
jgi:hypothetical protein